jgi:hypothetical protein
LGFPVSGLGNFHLIQTTIRGPELWTGGAFGPEAGLVLLAGLTLGVALVYLYTVVSAHSAIKNPRNR